MTFSVEIREYLNNSDVWNTIRQMEEIWESTEPNEMKLAKRKKKYIKYICKEIIEMETLLSNMLKQERADVETISKLVEQQDMERIAILTELKEDVTAVPHQLKLFSKKKWLREELVRLKGVKDMRMRDFLDLVDKKTELETLLGVTPTEFDTQTVPTDRVEKSLKTLVGELIHEKEMREQRYFSMSERMTNLIGILGYEDLDASSINNFMGNDGTSIKEKDLKIVQNSLLDLETAYKKRWAEVQAMLKNIRDGYTKLEISDMDQLALATGAVCPIEDLLAGDNYATIIKEDKKIQRMKKENSGLLLSKCRKTLEELQTNCFISEDEMESFCKKTSSDNVEENLKLVETEIQKLSDFHLNNESLIGEVWEIIQLYTVAHDVVQRMTDPMRLFKARGNQMVKEEEDRRRARMLPKKCAKVLEHGLSIDVYGDPLEDFIQGILTKFEEQASAQSKGAISRQKSTRSNYSGTTTGSSTLLRSTSNLGISRSTRSSKARDEHAPPTFRGRNTKFPPLVVRMTEPSVNMSRDSKVDDVDFGISCANSTEVGSVSSTRQDVTEDEWMNDEWMGGMILQPGEGTDKRRLAQAPLLTTSWARGGPRVKSPGPSPFLQNTRKGMRRSRSYSDLRVAPLPTQTARQMRSITEEREKLRGVKNRRRSRTVETPISNLLPSSYGSNKMAYQSRVLR